MTRILIAGLGDTGLLTAIRLARHEGYDVVGISATPGLVSGQELGLRLARPGDWARDYAIDYRRFRRLDGVRIVHGALRSLDPAERVVTVETKYGEEREPYDVLVIATGVSNGFWRRPDLRDRADVDADLDRHHDRFAQADSIAIVGGGAAAVSSAAHLAARWPATKVDLYFPGERALPQHHPKVWTTVHRRLDALNVGIHPRHRAHLPERLDEIGSDPIAWSTGQPPTTADAVLWAVGRAVPNTAWLPEGLLDDDGFVVVRPDLQAAPGIFAIGDVAATDELRSSARNRADKLLAYNVHASIVSDEPREYRPPRGRWGSVLGAQRDGLQVFAPSGHAFRFPAWSVNSVLQPLIVRRGIYGGVRRRARRPRTAGR